MVSRKLLASFHWCSSSGSSKNKTKNKLETPKKNFRLVPMIFIPLQDVILLEDERLVVAVVFVDFLVFFFNFALGLAVLL